MVEAQPSPACAGERMLQEEWDCQPALGAGQGASGAGDRGMCPWDDPEVMLLLAGGDGCPGKRWAVVLG